MPCAFCRREPFFTGRVAGAFYYRGSGGALVRGLKFGGQGGAGIFLGRLLGRAARVGGLDLGGETRLVPVPLHRAKLRRRGIHQAGILAREVASRVGLTVVEGLKRVRDTPPQGDPLTISREKNVRHAFASRGRRWARKLQGRPVILVDDVTTSGATARECARVLRHSGVASVELLVACLGGR